MDRFGETRVVLDSNIYVSALLFRGKPLQAVQLAEESKYTLLISDPIQVEVERILRERFGYSQAMIAKSCRRIWSRAERVFPTIRVELCRDPDDNRVLECAVAGGAQYLVTGDRDLLDMPPAFPFTILKVADFLQRLHTSP
jgi:putative PIN family toxin of toxin-antitoxin system